jgi:hypothetical protein
MPITIKPPDAVAKKYVARAGVAGPDYSAGVQNPRRDWMQATEAASSAYAGGVQTAINNQSFQKGVARVTSAKWQRKAAGVGASRYAPGVQAAQADYQNGVTPYLTTIANLTLPPRLPKGDPGNLQRVAAIATALRQKKLQG